MFNAISKFYNSKDPALFSLKLLVNIAIIYTATTYYFRHLHNGPPIYLEGFTQQEPFVLKRNEGCYDEFYTQIYDDLYTTEKRINWELYRVLKMTMPSTTDSTFLSIGSGTGRGVYELTEAGYDAYGLENCPLLVKESEKQYPNSTFIQGDVTQPLLFDQYSFTHILCTDFQIYKHKNKERFFTNCFHWLKPNGYMVVHLVERDRFNAISPRRDEEVEWKPFPSLDISPQKTKASCEFDDYTYQQYYHIPANVSETNVVIFRETFTDKETRHVRQNEHTLYMENLKDILRIAKSIGFIFHAKCTMKKYNGEEHQYLYILEKPM